MGRNKRRAAAVQGLELAARGTCCRAYDPGWLRNEKTPRNSNLPPKSSPWPDGRNGLAWPAADNALTGLGDSLERRAPDAWALNAPGAEGRRLSAAGGGARTSRCWNGAAILYGVDLPPDRAAPIPGRQCATLARADSNATTLGEGKLAEGGGEGQPGAERGRAGNIPARRTWLAGSLAGAGATGAGGRHGKKGPEGQGNGPIFRQAFRPTANPNGSGGSAACVDVVVEGSGSGDRAARGGGNYPWPHDSGPRPGRGEIRRGWATRGLGLELGGRAGRVCLTGSWPAGQSTSCRRGRALASASNLHRVCRSPGRTSFKRRRRRQERPWVARSTA